MSKATTSSKIKTTTTTTASLVCQQTLYPPTRTFGDGSTSLQYATGSTAWQCTFSTDGQYLAACFGAPDLSIRVWKKKNQQQQQQQQKGSKQDREDDDDDDENQHENKNVLWEFQTAISGIHERTVRSIAFAPIISPLILASGSFDGTICIWEYSNTLKDFDCAAQLEGQESEIKAVAWNATGSLLASCSRDKSIWIWECFLPGTVGGSDRASSDSGDFDCIAVLSSHQGDVKDVKFALSHGEWGDGDEILLSASYDDTIKCWAEDAGDWYCAASISNVHKSTIWSLTVAPGGGRVVSCSGDGSIGILKCYTAQEKRQRFPKEDDGISGGLWKCVGKLPDAHSLPIYYVDYAPAKAGHGRIASAAGDNRIQIYREAIGSSSDQPLFSLDTAVSTDHGDVNCVCWHPHDGSMLASAGDDGAVRIWKYRTGS